MSKNFDGIKTQKFGVEIECTGLTRSAAAKAVAKVIGGSPEHFGGSYDRYDVYDSQGRRWKIMSDASIRCTNKKRLWYGDDREYHPHYDSSRYRCLNLHPVFTDNNIEVRAFNSCLNAGVLRAYISLVLAVSNQALTQKSASPRVTQSENPRYTFRTWLIRIGLNGQEFKNCRKHLLSHLEGNIAWLHQEDAITQRERLKQERIAAREQRVEPVSEVQELNENVPDENSEPTESECGDFVEYEEDEEMGMEMSM